MNPQIDRTDTDSVFETGNLYSVEFIRKFVTDLEEQGESIFFLEGKLGILISQENESNIEFVATNVPKVFQCVS